MSLLAVWQHAEEGDDVMTQCTNAAARSIEMNTASGCDCLPLLNVYRPQMSSHAIFMMLLELSREYAYACMPVRQKPGLYLGPVG